MIYNLYLILPEEITTKVFIVRMLLACSLCSSSHFVIYSLPSFHVNGRVFTKKYIYVFHGRINLQRHNDVKWSDISCVNTRQQISLVMWEMLPFIYNDMINDMGLYPMKVFFTGVSVYWRHTQVAFQNTDTMAEYRFGPTKVSGVYIKVVWEWNWINNKSNSTTLDE